MSLRHPVAALHQSKQHTASDVVLLSRVANRAAKYLLDETHCLFD